MPYAPGTPKVLRMQHMKGCYYSSSGSAFNNPTPRTMVLSGIFFLDLTPKSKAPKVKMNKRNYIKLKASVQ